MSLKTDKLGSDVLLAAAKTSMGSKIVGAESDFFGQLVVDAIKAVETTDQVSSMTLCINLMLNTNRCPCCVCCPSVCHLLPFWLFSASVH